jgi:hypothetical protein
MCIIVSGKLILTSIRGCLQKKSACPNCRKPVREADPLDLVFAAHGMNYSPVSPVEIAARLSFLTGLPREISVVHDVLLAKNKELFEEFTQMTRNIAESEKENKEGQRKLANLQAGVEALKELLRNSDVETDRLRVQLREKTTTEEKLTGYYSQALEENRVLQAEVHTLTMQLAGMSE